MIVKLRDKEYTRDTLYDLSFPSERWPISVDVAAPKQWSYVIQWERFKDGCHHGFV